MAFTAGELSNIANASLDFYYNRGDTFKNAIQAKPLLRFMESGAKSFPGGKGNISLAVKGDYGAAGVNDSVVGYTHNDTVNFYTPANIKRVNYPWREHHIGITLTHTELKIDGISVTDEMGNGSGTSNHSDREVTVLVNLLQDKLEDFGEQYARNMNKLLWGDGVADAKALAGIRSIIKDVPNTGTTGGLDRVANTWWRNRAATAAFGTAGGRGAVTSSPTGGGALIQFLTQEYRQLCRYGGRPTKFLAGTDFIAALEAEFRANGNYTLSGFTGPQDGSIGAVKIQGGVTVEYDPTLDDLGLNKRGYWFDPRHIYLMKQDGEWDHRFTPARPYNQFVMYKSATYTGQMCAQQLNSSLVVDIV
jgi:hypothetical protein